MALDEILHALRRKAMGVQAPFDTSNDSSIQHAFNGSVITEDIPEGIEEEIGVDLHLVVSTSVDRHPAQALNPRLEGALDDTGDDGRGGKLNGAEDLKLLLEHALDISLKDRGSPTSRRISRGDRRHCGSVSRRSRGEKGTHLTGHLHNLRNDVIRKRAHALGLGVAAQIAAERRLLEKFRNALRAESHISQKKHIGGVECHGGELWGGEERDSL